MDEEIIKIIPIHYDVDSHAIDLNIFIKAALGVKTIALDFGEKLCGKNIQCKVLILPPEEGSFLQKLGIAIMAGTIGFVSNEIASGIVVGLTGKDIREWSANATECIKTCVIEFMQKTDEDLKMVLPQNIDFRKSQKAKNEFYTSCINSPEIRGVGFNSESNNFPISRKQFADFINLKLDASEIEIIRKLHKLTIVSPIIVSEIKTKWKFKIWGQGKKVFNISVKDEVFMNGVLCGKYPLKTESKDDVILASVVYSTDLNGMQYPEYIEEVFSINSIKIADIPPGVKLDEEYVDENPRQMKLFQ